jgi:peptide/nickel transport system permease protein
MRAITSFYNKTRYFWRRLLIAFLTLVLVAVFGFLLIKLMPGNPVDTYAQTLMTERRIPFEEARALAKQMLNYDPDEKILVQLGKYIDGLAHGNLGISMRRPDITVNRLIAGFLPWTLFISSVSLFLSFIVGIFMGSHMAWRRKGVGEKAALSYIVVSGSIPDYLWGMILIFVFGVRFRIFPVQGNYDVMLEYEGWPWFLNVLYHAALPILAYSIVQIGSWALSMRASSIGVLGDDYIYAARARGIPERIIVNRYLRRNAMLPLVTSLALSFAGLFGGSSLMESIFNYPGLGQQFSAFMGARDYFIIQGLILFMSFMIVLANLVVDSIYSLIDPRIRRST